MAASNRARSDERTATPCLGLAGRLHEERAFPGRIAGTELWSPDFVRFAVAFGGLGIRVDPRDVRVRNVAAVMVTARLPPFAKPGQRIDVNVASMGNARSLDGGVLLATPLSGADGQVYALSQGPVHLGGYEVAARGSRLRKNSPTSGRVAGGATVERAVPVDLSAGPLVFTLGEADFGTAGRMAQAFNQLLGDGAARALDPSSVQVQVPEGYKENVVGLVAELEEVEIDADVRARVVISERTGTVVAGANVRIRPVAVSHGALHIAVGESPVISQPGPFARNGETVSERIAIIEAEESGKGAIALPATSSVDELVRALNTLGVGPRDLIAILQAIKVAGALDAELVVL